MLEKIRNYDRKSEESLLISERLLKDPDFSSSATILAFCPLKSEPDITKSLEGKNILYPYIRDGRMEFSKAERLVKSPLGFLEPENPETADYDHAVILVPMVAFNEEGYRLGRGGGFYDRYLEENRHRLTIIGVAFSVSQSDSLPVESHDQRLDRIITGL